jgi:hypothetical protein
MKIHFSRGSVGCVMACLLMLLALASTALPAAAATRSNEANFAQSDAYVSSQMQEMRLQV